MLHTMEGYFEHHVLQTKLTEHCFTGLMLSFDLPNQTYYLI